MNLFYGLWNIRMTCTYFIHSNGILKDLTRRKTKTYMPKALIILSTAVNLHFTLGWKRKQRSAVLLLTSFRRSSTRCAFLAPGYFHHRGSYPLTLIVHPLQVSTAAVWREVNLWHISKPAALQVNESPDRHWVGVAVVNIWPGIRKSLSRCEKHIEHLVCWWVMPP